MVIGGGIAAALLLTLVLLLYARRRENRECSRLRASLAAEQDLAPHSPGTLRFRAQGSTQHALWLDLELLGRPNGYGFEAQVAADGVALVHARDDVLAEGAADDATWYTEGREELNLFVRVTGKGIRIVQRIAVFTPGQGALVEAHARFMPDSHTTSARGRAFVTREPEPGGSTERTPREGLAPLARAFGMVPQGSGLRLACGRFSCLIIPQTVSREVVALEFTLKRPALPELELRPEPPEVAAAKAASYEPFTGHADFDCRVGISSFSTRDREAVRALFANPAACRAVVSLVADGSHLSFGPTGIDLINWQGPPEPMRVRATLQLLSQLAETLP